MNAVRGQAVLALDQGSHASRACLIDDSGAVLAAHSVPVATHTTDAGHIEQDPLELVQSLRQAAAAVVRSAPVPVLAAGLATQRSTFVCCRRPALEPLSAAISWQDRRNADWLPTLRADADAVRERTGLPLSPHYGASKMRWCLDHLPAVKTAAARGELLLAPLATYLCAALTGDEPRVDPANASRTLLWSAGTFDWSEAQLALFGVDRAQLPRCVPTDAGFGRLRIGGQSIPLRVCTGDQSAVPFVTGAPDDAALYINLGTGAFVQRPLTAPASDAAPLLASVLGEIGAQRWYSLEGTVNGAGSALSWYCQQQQRDEAQFWPALDTLAPAAPLPLFINGIGGLGSPWWQAQVESRFADHVAGNAPLAQFAAVLESIVFMLTRNVELMRRRGPALTQLWAGGGISRSHWLCQRLAESLQLPVQRLPEEATLRGVACLVAPHWAPGFISPAGERFSPHAHPELAARRQRFDQLIDQAANWPSTQRLA